MIAMSVVLSFFSSIHLNLFFNPGSCTFRRIAMAMAGSYTDHSSGSGRFWPGQKKFGFRAPNQSPSPPEALLGSGVFGLGRFFWVFSGFFAPNQSLSLPGGIGRVGLGWSDRAAHNQVYLELLLCMKDFFALFITCSESGTGDNICCQLLKLFAEFHFNFSAHVVGCMIFPLLDQAFSTADHCCCHHL
uniref:Uncharacterized protein n=1 Tax=Arundo donax TaxID=35708 RepID=A0A0A8ZW48_ARUDO